MEEFYENINTSLACKEVYENNFILVSVFTNSEKNVFY